VMIAEANSTQVILSQFPGGGYPLGPNVTKSYADTMAAEGRAASEVWRVKVPNDSAFNRVVSKERGLGTWAFTTTEGTTQCSIAASRALQAGGVDINTITTGTLWPGLFGNNLQSHAGPGIVRIH